MAAQKWKLVQDFLESETLVQRSNTPYSCIKLYFACENIKKSCISLMKIDVLVFLCWLSWAQFRFLSPITFFIFGQIHKVRVFNFLIRSKDFLIKCSGFAEIFSISTPAVSVLANMAYYATSSLIWHNVTTCMTSYNAFIASPQMKYALFPSLDGINGIFIP